MKFITRKHALQTTLVCGLALAGSAFAHGKDIDAKFKSMDTNGDGKISAEEHAAAAQKMFDSMDANKDGRVTAEEMTAAHEKKMGKKAGKSTMSSAEKIKEMDTDGDGVLTSTEHANGSKVMFEKMDTDKDGFLSKTEFVEGHEKMMKKTST